MKDIIIGSTPEKELRILLICFACSFLLNIAAIIIYKPLAEIITQIGYVIIIALCALCVDCDYPIDRLSDFEIFQKRK